MAAEPGNQHWRRRSSHGRKPIFASPHDLWAACEEYFEWVMDNPLREEELFIHRGVASRASVEKMRAMTIGGLCLFLNIGRTTWDDYGTRPGFEGVVERVASVIYVQKFEGAAAGLFNPSIIARELGLSDNRGRHRQIVRIEPGSAGL